MDIPDGMTRSVRHRTAAPAAGSTACPLSTRGERRHVGPDCPNGGRRLRDRPEVKTVVRETFSIEPIDGIWRQTIGNVTVEDLGETQGVVTSVQVQECDGPLAGRS